MEFPSSAELRATAVFSLLNLFFAQLRDQPPLWASSREKQQKRQNWRRDGAKAVIRHLPMSCLLSRAAGFPHKKLEQVITCSAAYVTHSSCSHVPSPCSPQPNAHSCIPAGDKVRATPVTAGEILCDGLSHPTQPWAGPLACPWAGDASQNHLLLLYLEVAAMVDSLVLATGFFFPILYPAK